MYKIIVPLAFYIYCLKSVNFRHFMFHFSFEYFSLDRYILTESWGVKNAWTTVTELDIGFINPKSSRSLSRLGGNQRKSSTKRCSGILCFFKYLPLEKVFMKICINLTLAPLPRFMKNTHEIFNRNLSYFLYFRKLSPKIGNYHITNPRGFASGIFVIRIF